MGARQSKRSVDITTTPKKEGLPAEAGVVGDAAAPGDGKLERIEETDTKPTTNGIGPHTETVEEKNQDEATEKDKEEVKSEETKVEATVDTPAEAAEVTTPTEATPASPNSTTSPENKETKKKDKTKKHKFSFRTFSFGKKDKTKPAREDTPKNGDVAKEEPLVEGGEEAENATAAASSPVDKSEVSSPVESETAPTAPATEAKEVEKSAASPAEEKKEEATPVAEKEKPAEKVEAAVAEKVESIPESGAPVENNISANEVSTTGSVDEAPKSPPPAVPVEVSVSPAPAPVITEDVASVTKVIEEIDISEKAVAAAVKEAIENPNEIVVDSNLQNHMNE